MKFASLAIVGTLVIAPWHIAQATEGHQTDTETGMAMASAQDSMSKGSVARAAITSDVQDREPVDSLSTVTADDSKVFYFTEIQDMAGHTVTHRWEYNGQVMAEVGFEIGGPRWRVYSSKTMTPYWVGDWKVSVIDEDGSPLSVNTFSYTASSMTQ
ncbi:MAG: DUF2914 domain-containing protein [Gammaproteobacteria bacterium]|jgi:hypothetical protein|nr:DUF2914 domain-containing protein [Gammaproteobacteria bacterium]